MASPSESDDPAAAAAASSRERQEQQHPVPPTLNDQDDDDEDDDEENALPGMWMEGDSLAPPCQSDLDIVPEVVSLAQVTAQDVLFDLGCGDGRVCIEAAKATGARGVGVEIEPHLVAKFHARLQRATPPLREGQVEVVQGDLLELDLGRATVIYLYLLPEGIATLRPKLEECLSKGRSGGVRIVCNTWGLPGRTPTATRDVGAYNNVRLLLYTSDSSSSGDGDGDGSDDGQKDV